MATTAPSIQRVFPHDLQEILAQIHDQKHKTLILLGPDVGLSSSQQDWPEEFKNFHVVFQLTEYVENLGELLLPLSHVTSLSLWGNRLGDTGAQHIARLPILTLLDLSSNELTDAGARHLSTLSTLNTLHLAGNQVGDLGTKYLAGLSALTTLDLSSNEVTDTGVQHLPKLSNLNTLHLAGNQVGDAGARHLAGLLTLTTLDLSSNKLTDAGTQHLAHLPALRSVNLSHNGLTNSGAKYISRLSTLTRLNLAHNELTNPGARHLSTLLELIELDLARNHVGDKGARHLSTLPKLTVLNLENNHVGDMGARYLANLPAITLLNLSHTRITDISPLITLFKKGIPARWDEFGSRGILVKDSPLVHPPPEVIQQGHEAVLNYFQEVERQGVDRLFEAKLLIVGEGRAGKTSLVRRLYQTHQSLPTEEETTRGIDIHREMLQLPECGKFRLNVWDFGGQQIYHATHQFFLTKNSLYVLLDDTAKDHKFVTDEGFKYWLEVVEWLSERSPVLIFQNEKGGRSKTIDEAGIKGRFPNVKDVYRGNLEHTHSADKLRRAIECAVQELPHIGEKVPAKWVSIRTAIECEARRTPYISLDHYFDIYRHHLDFERPQALYLSRYLHDLGVFLHFQDSPLLNRIVILQNQWATEAVFRILDDERVKNQRGRFTLADCQRRWATSDYEDKHHELLALMEKFELCYALADADHTWLAPQLLPPSTPPFAG